MNDRIDYLAGIFDGEGSFSIQAQFRNHKLASGAISRTIRFNPRMTMSLKEGHGDTQCVMDLLVENLGGSVYRDNIGLSKWSMGKIEHLKEVCEVFVPKLIVKKDIGNRFIKALNEFPSRKGFVQSYGQKPWDRERCKKVAKMAYELNPSNRFKQSLEDLYLEIDMYYE